LNNESERNNGKHRTPQDELADIFKLIGQHNMIDEVSNSNLVFEATAISIRVKI